MSTNLALADPDIFVGGHSADWIVRPVEYRYRGGAKDIARINDLINLSDKIDMNWTRVCIFWKAMYFWPQGKFPDDPSKWGKVEYGVTSYVRERLLPFVNKMKNRPGTGGIIICLVPSAPYSPHADNNFFHYTASEDEATYDDPETLCGKKIADVGSRQAFWSGHISKWEEETRLNFEPHWLPSDSALGKDYFSQYPGDPDYFGNRKYEYTWEYFCTKVAWAVDTILKPKDFNIKIYYEIMNEPFNRTWASIGFGSGPEENKRITANEAKLEKILRYGVIGIKRRWHPGCTINELDNISIETIPINLNCVDNIIIFGHLNDKIPDYAWNDSSKWEEVDAGCGWNQAVLDYLINKSTYEGKNVRNVYCNAFAFHPYHFHSPDSLWSWCAYKDNFYDKVTYIKYLLSQRSSAWPPSTPLFITECGWHGTMRADVEDEILIDNPGRIGSYTCKEWGKFLKDYSEDSNHPYTSSMENVWIGSEYKKGWMEFIFKQKSKDMYDYPAYHSARNNYLNYYSWQVNFRDNRENKTQQDMDRQYETKYKNEGHTTSETTDGSGFSYTELLKGWFGNSNWVKVNYVNPKMFSNPKLNEVNVANYLIKCLQKCRDANIVNPGYPIKGFIYWHFADYRNEWDDHWRHMGIFHAGCSNTLSSGSSRISLGNNYIGPARLAAFAVKRFQKTVVPSFSRENYAKVNDNTLAVKDSSILNKCISNISSKINNSENIGSYKTGKWRSGRCMSTGSIQQRACIQLPSNWTTITINNGKHSVTTLILDTILDYIPWKCPHKLYFYWGTTGNENEMLSSKFDSLVSTSSSSPNSITINKPMSNFGYIWIIGQSDYPYDFIWGNYAVDGEIPPQGKNITAKMLPPYMHISPNPFYSKLKMEYFVSNQNQKQNLVSITLYDISGKRISEIINKQCKSGKHSIEYRMDKFKPGVYFCRYIIDGKVISTQKILHLAESAIKE